MADARRLLPDLSRRWDLVRVAGPTYSVSPRSSVVLFALATA
jgi:hypothetical protein